MRLTDKLVEKFGADKLLHFFVAALLVAECKNYGIITDSSDGLRLSSCRL